MTAIYILLIIGYAYCLTGSGYVWLKLNVQDEMKRTIMIIVAAAFLGTTLPSCSKHLCAAYAKNDKEAGQKAGEKRVGEKRVGEKRVGERKVNG